MRRVCTNRRVRTSQFRHTSRAVAGSRSTAVSLLSTASATHAPHAAVAQSRLAGVSARAIAASVQSMAKLSSSTIRWNWIASGDNPKSRTVAVAYPRVIPTRRAMT